MERPPFQLSVTALLALVACLAFNFWLFRVGPLWGIIGLNLSKHVIIAYLCQVLGVDKRRGQDRRLSPPPVPSHAPAR